VTVFFIALPGHPRECWTRDLRGADSYCDAPSLCSPIRPALVWATTAGMVTI